MSPPRVSSTAHPNGTIFDSITVNRASLGARTAPILMATDGRTVDCLNGAETRLS